MERLNGCCDVVMKFLAFSQGTQTLFARRKKRKRFLSLSLFRTIWYRGKNRLLCRGYCCSATRPLVIRSSIRLHAHLIMVRREAKKSMTSFLAFLSFGRVMTWWVGGICCVVLNEWKERQHHRLFYSTRTGRGFHPKCYTPSSSCCNVTS